MIVCIAEKPSVAREIAQILGANTKRNGYLEGNGYYVTWTFGHLCSLKEPGDYQAAWKYWKMIDLPMIPNKFSIKLIENESSQKQFHVIADLIDKADEVINCGDAGQEGELIQRWVMHLAKCKKPVKRLWISSLTEEAIKEGFENLQDAQNFDRLYMAGSARAIGDWLLGLNATRLYTLKYAKGAGKTLSIGRVQTPTLSLVVERQKEIDNFVSTPFYEIKTLYKDVTFSLKWDRIEEKDKAEAILDDIKEHDLEITLVEAKKGKESAPKLFDLTSLQVECNKKHGFTAEETLKYIQSLYEKKMTTYPRVDTTYLPTDMYPKVGGILKSMTPYGKLTEPILKDKIRKSTNVFNDKKITDHHAIIPTGKIFTNISVEEKRVYDMIAKRFIAAFYPDCIVLNTTVEAKVETADQTYPFSSQGKQILENGWRDVFATDKKEQTEEDMIMPAYEKGEKGPHTPFCQEKMTSPPKYYTEATLLRAMESAGKKVDDEELRDALKENGIGRPSTRASIIETLFKRQYIVRDKKRILATQTGIDLINIIENDLLKSVELTGQWEKKMRDIEKGNYQMDDFMNEIKAMVQEVVQQVKRSEKKQIYLPPKEETTQDTNDKTAKDAEGKETKPKKKRATKKSKQEESNPKQ